MLEKTKEIGPDVGKNKRKSDTIPKNRGFGHDAEEQPE